MGKDMKLNQKTIQRLRVSKCWSQEELAAACGVSVRTIQRVEKSGQSSLETTKALSAVFGVTPNDLQADQSLEKYTFIFILNYAWLVAFAFSSLFFGLWIVDILIPTLKGADFNQQYEIHNNFRYLDFGGGCFLFGFILLAVNVFRAHLNRKKFSSPVN